MGLAVVMVMVAVAVQASGTSSEAPLGLLDLLDSLSLVMAGGGFSRGVYRQLTTAMAKFDPQLLESQDAGWRGMVQYYETGGGLGDTWGAFPSK